MIQLKQIKDSIEVMRYLPGVNEGITVIVDGRSYFDKWVNGEDWKE